MMGALAPLPLIDFAVTGYAQETEPVFDGRMWEASNELPVPKVWMRGRFPIPISFAPQTPYKRNGIRPQVFTDFLRSITDC
jgi:hypothetical protein